jgi:5-methylthioadenosine/S-adenosylhomocysteine deaminase
MKKVDCLITNAIVLTMDKDFQQFEHGSVVIGADSILAVGPDEVISQDYTSDQIIDAGGKILMPGLVNTHSHVPMTLMRGLADDLRLDVWLMGYMMPVEREFVTPEFVRLGTRLACAEMIRSGVTCFADMYYFEETVAEATAEAGMRALCGETVLKFPTPDAPSFEESLAISRDFIRRWKGHPLIIPSIAPHTPYTCTDEILKAATALAVEYDVPLQIHISETALEVENMRNQSGMPVVPYVKKQALFDAKVLAAHCVHIDEGEMRTLQHVGAGVAHNPSSNLKLASGIAPIRRMIDLGLNVGIGTDGAASNNDLDMFEELRLAAFLAKGSTGDPTAIPARTALLMATRMGAQAMHLGSLTGSIEPGKRADLILVDVHTLHNTPHFKRDPNNAYAQIVYAAKATDVQDVMINGRWVMRERRLLTLDEETLIRESQEYARKIDIFLIQREQSVLSKLIAIGGATEEESFEVQAKVAVEDLTPILRALQNPEIEILRERHFREYDTYFGFDDANQGRIRYREDHFIGPNGEITNVRSRLTHIGPAREFYFPEGALLSRSRFLAPASQSLRFYKEYFQPLREVEIEKERLRYLIRYHETEFFVNLDTVSMPRLGMYVEVKSRTWSRKDAEQKSRLVAELLQFLGASSQGIQSQDYIEMLERKKSGDQDLQ